MIFVRGEPHTQFPCDICILLSVYWVFNRSNCLGTDTVPGAFFRRLFQNRISDYVSVWLFLVYAFYLSCICIFLAKINMQNSIHRNHLRFQLKCLAHLSLQSLNQLILCFFKHETHSQSQILLTATKDLWYHPTSCMPTVALYVLFINILCYLIQIQTDKQPFGRQVVFNFDFMYYVDKLRA